MEKYTIKPIKIELEPLFFGGIYSFIYYRVSANIKQSASFYILLLNNRITSYNSKTPLQTIE
jgi:hypothetical protein